MTAQPNSPAPQPGGPPMVPANFPPGPPPQRPGAFKRGFGSGFGWALGAGLVALALAAVTTGIFGMALVAMGGAATSSTSTRTTVWGDPTAENVAVAIPVTGMIMGDSAGQPPLFGQGTYGYDVAAQLDDLDAEDADAVILEMNTPGGTIYGSRAISDAVERYQKRTKKPVVAFVRGISASGGMYAMAGADEIIVDHGTLVGSIGVIMGPFERYRDVKAVDGGLLSGGVTTTGGIENYYISRGKGKDFGNPYRDMTPEEKANIDSWMNSEYDSFVQHVAKRRNVPAKTIVDSYGAYVFGGQQAIDNKLADAELGQEDAYRRVAELAGVKPAQLQVQMEQSQASLLNTLLSGSSAAKGGTAKADTTELQQGRTALRASALCTGTASVLAVHGDLADFCR